MAENVVKYRDVLGDGTDGALGPELQVDLTNGFVYDQHGNQVDRWIPADNEKTACLSDYVAEQALLQSAYALSKWEPDRAHQMLLNAGVDPGRLVKMDLAPSDVHIPAALPNFASGYKNEPPIADLVAPPLLVDKQVNDYFQFAKEDAFQRAEPLAGAAGQVGEISPRLSNSQYSCKERALGGWVSTQVEANADTPLRIMQATATRVLNALTLDREIRVANQVLTSSNWDSSVVTALGGSAYWDGGAASDPLHDLHVQIEASWGPVTAIVMGRQIFHAFLRNPAVQKYFAYKSGVKPIPSAEEVAGVLDLPPIYVGHMQYINTSNAKVYVWNSSVALICQPPQLPPMDQQHVASLYTFRWNVQAPKDGSSSGGFIVRRFFTQDRGTLGGEKIVVAHFDAEKFTSQFAGGLITGAFV